MRRLSMPCMCQRDLQGRAFCHQPSAYICVAEESPVEASRQRLIQHI